MHSPSRRRAPAAVAYYAALASRAQLVYHVSPFAAGAHPVPFSFDWSIDYYPRQYRLPGPGDERLPPHRRALRIRSGPLTRARPIL